MLKWYSKVSLEFYRSSIHCFAMVITVLVVGVQFVKELTGKYLVRTVQ